MTETIDRSTWLPRNRPPRPSIDFIESARERTDFAEIYPGGLTYKTIERKFSFLRKSDHISLMVWFWRYELRRFVEMEPNDEVCAKIDFINRQIARLRNMAIEMR